LDLLSIDGTDTLSRNVGKKLPLYANTPEEHRSLLFPDGSLKSREVMSTFRIYSFGEMSHICPQRISRGTVMFHQLDPRDPPLKTAMAFFSKCTGIGDFRLNILNP